MKQPKKLSLSRIINAVKKDNGTGFCVKCGHTRKYCEPDARQYPCDNCKENKVYGAEECLFMVQS